VVTINNRVTIRIPEKLHTYVVSEAKKRHTTVSAVIVVFVNQKVDHCAREKVDHLR